MHTDRLRQFRPLLLLTALAAGPPAVAVESDDREAVLAARHAPFAEFAAEPAPVHPPARRSVGVQIERNETGLRLGDLSFPYLFEALYKRHSAAAAHILDRSADSAAGRDIPVYNIDDGFFDYPTAAFRAVAEAADVISLSQQARVTRAADAAFTAAGAPLASAEGVETLRALWAGTDVAVFHAIGNDPARARLAYPETNLNWIFNDLYVRVGLGHRRPDGTVAVDARSPAHAVSLLAEIPDYSFRLYSEPEAALARTERYLLANRAFYEAALIRAVAEGRESPFNLGLCRGRSGRDAPFDGRMLIDRPAFSQLSVEMSELFRAYSVCAVESLRDYYVRSGRDPAVAHSLRAIGGTSFSTPALAGLFLAAHERAPELGKHDLLAAMILSAAPAAVIAAGPESPEVAVRAAPNGRGIPSSDAGGFGLVTGAAFAAEVEALRAFRATRPGLKTIETDVGSEVVTFDADPGLRDGVREYMLPVRDAALFFRGVLVANFGDGNRAVPTTVEIVDPSGAIATVSPSRFRGGSNLTLAGTDAFFGAGVAGEWRVRVPAPHRLVAAGLAIEGVAAGPGSLIDAWLDSRGHHAHPAIELAAPHDPDPTL